MKRFWKETFGACGRMLLEIFMLFPVLLVLGNGLMGKTAMLPVFFAEIAIAGLLGVLLRRFIPSTLVVLVIGVPLCIGEIILFARLFGGIWPNAYIMPSILTLLTFYRGKQHAASPWDQILPNYILFTALVLQFIVLLFARLHGVIDEYFTLMCIVVPVAYITAYIVLNNLGLRNLVDEAQARTSASSLTVGGGMKPLNRSLLAIILIIAVALSLGTVLMTAATWIFDKIVFAVGWLLKIIFGFKIESTASGQSSGGDETPFAGMEFESGDMTFWGPIFNVIGYIGLGIVAIGLVILLYKFVRYLIRVVTEVFAKFSEMGDGGSGEGTLFEDTRETLVDLSQLPKMYAQSAKDRIAGMFRRQPGWNDMPTPAEKLKYLYRKVLQKAEGSGYRHQKSYTAEEATRTAAQSWKPLANEAQTLADTYGALRYGDRDPDPDALETLHHRLGDL